MEYEELKDAIRGLTKAQRRCLDNHGAGFAGGHPKTVEKLESLGLLAGRDKILGGGLPVKVREYLSPVCLDAQLGTVRVSALCRSRPHRGTTREIRTSENPLFGEGPPAPGPRMRRGMAVPSYVLPQHRSLYLKLANQHLAKFPNATPVELEQAARLALEQNI